MTCKPLPQSLAMPWRESPQSLAPNQPRWEMNGAYDKTARGWGGPCVFEGIPRTKKQLGPRQAHGQASPLGSANGAGLDASADRPHGGRRGPRARDKDTRIYQIRDKSCSD